MIFLGFFMVYNSGWWIVGLGLARKDPSCRHSSDAMLFDPFWHRLRNFPIFPTPELVEEKNHQKILSFVWYCTISDIIFSCKFIVGNAFFILPGASKRTASGTLVFLVVISWTFLTSSQNSSTCWRAIVHQPLWLHSVDHNNRDLVIIVHYFHLNCIFQSFHKG